jgi:hypothetical protein
VAPVTPEAATLKKNRGPDPRSVMNGEALNVEDQSGVAAHIPIDYAPARCVSITVVQRIQVLSDFLFYLRLFQNFSFWNKLTFLLTIA